MPESLEQVQSQYQALAEPKRIGFVTGHGLAGPVTATRKETGFSPLHGPSCRNASSEDILNPERTSFVNHSTSNEPGVSFKLNAMRACDRCVRSFAEHKFQLHDFVIMPDPFTCWSNLERRHDHRGKPCNSSKAASRTV